MLETGLDIYNKTNAQKIILTSKKMSVTVIGFEKVFDNIKRGGIDK